MDDARPSRSRPSGPASSPIDSEDTIEHSWIRRTAIRWCSHALALGLATLGAARPALAQQNGTGPLVTDVDLRGVHHVDAEELRGSLATQPSVCRSVLYQPFCWFSNSPAFVDRRYIDPSEIPRDEARIGLFYWLRGYRTATASGRIEPDDHGVRVVFTVTEGPPTVVRALRITQQDSVLSSAAVERAMTLATGDPFDVVALDSSVARLYDALWDRGFADATIAVDTTTTAGPDQIARDARITLRVDPKYRTSVARVDVFGNERVSDRSVKRLITLQPGSLYSRHAVVESQRDLVASGLFKAVNIVTPPPGDTAKLVEIHVSPADLHRLDLTAGFNNVDFVQLDAQFTRLNFLGNARRLSLSATVGNLLSGPLSRFALFDDRVRLANGDDRFQRLTWQGNVDFFQPWFLSARNELGASIFSHRSSVPGIIIDRGYGARALVTRTLARHTTATLAYTFESSSVDASDIYFCVTFGVCVQSTIGALGVRHTLSPVSLVGQIDHTDVRQEEQPTHGYRARLELEHASRATASDFRYHRILAEASRYVPLRNSGVLAGRLRAGWVDALSGTDAALGVPGLPEGGVVHPRKRFFAGGARSVRGFGENQLGPRILTISPAALTDTTLPNPCTTDQLASGTCNPNLRGLESSEFQPQPLGGTAVIDASVEYRFGITDMLDGAVFLDGALIGTDTFSDLLGATGAITPGVGVRLRTPIGPVRLDVGFRPRLVEDLPVVTQVTRTDGTRELVRLDARRRYDPTDGSGGVFRQILERLTLHLAVGPAF